jgi:hypothetical protein
VVDGRRHHIVDERFNIPVIDGVTHFLHRRLAASATTLEASFTKPVTTGINLTKLQLTPCGLVSANLEIKSNAPAIVPALFDESIA